MSVEQAIDVAPRMHEALEELKDLVRQRYPDATFRVALSPENPQTVLLKPVIDVVDRDDVMDVVIDRLVELQATEQLPLFVVPVCHHAGAGPSAGAAAQRPAGRRLAAERQRAGPRPDARRDVRWASIRIGRRRDRARSRRIRGNPHRGRALHAQGSE